MNKKELVAVQPASLIEAAVTAGADIAVIEKMMELQIRWEEREARKAYVEAMTAFKADPPKLKKTKQVKFGKTNYMHADLNEIVETATPALSKYKLSVTWDFEQNNGTVAVTCRVMHIDGHCESVTLSGPYDNSGGKNQIQGVVSTTTYLRRATYLAALGLTAGDMDDDGQAGYQQQAQKQPVGRMQPEQSNIDKIPLSEEHFNELWQQATVRWIGENEAWDKMVIISESINPVQPDIRKLPDAQFPLIKARLAHMFEREDAGK